MSRVSKRVRKVFSVLLLLLLLVNFYLLVIFPLHNYYNKRSDKITSLRNDYQEYYQISLAREQLEKEAKHISAMRESQGYFLKSDNNSLAAAELQAHVKKIIESSGGRLLSTQPIPTADSDKLQTVQVRVRMQGDMTVLYCTRRYISWKRASLQCCLIMWFYRMLMSVNNTIRIRK